VHKFGRVCLGKCSYFYIHNYAILCIPLDTCTVLYLHHNRTVSDGWRIDNLCDECSEEFRLILQPFVYNCTYKRSCGFNVCLRQTPTLRGLASHTVFQLTFNLSQFILTNRTLYHQYIYEIESVIVPEVDSIHVSRIEKWFCERQTVRFP